MNVFSKLTIISTSLTLALVFSTPAIASCDDISVTGMTDEQIITLKQNCIKMEKNATTVPQSSIVDKEHIEEYAELGKKYGIALSEVAKSIGTTVNDLSQTPVGLSMLIIVGWKVIGHDIFNIIGGSIWYLLMIFIFGHYFNKLVLKDREVFETFDPNTKALISREFSRFKWSEGQTCAAWVIGILFTLTTITALCIIF